MKNTFIAILLTLLILFSCISALAGLGMMVIDIYTDGNNFLKGFEVFCLSTILLFTCSISYMVTKILSSTDVLVDTMTRFVEHEISKANASPITNPLQTLFGNLGLGNLGGMGFPGTNTIIKIGHLDEDGNIVPLDESKFDSKDEFLEYRDNILGKAFGQKPADIKKKFEDMTIEELMDEEKKAVAKQNFELAAAILNVIENKKKKS